MSEYFHIGDSISLGQYHTLKEYFKCKYERYSPNKKEIITHENNCKESTAHLTDRFILNIPKSKVIIQNAGLWDLQLVNNTNRTTLKKYKKNLEIIFNKYSKMCENYVWVFTTEIQSNNPHNMRKEDWKAYSNAEHEMVEGFGIRAFKYNLSKCNYTDGVHFTDESYDVMAGQLITFLEKL